MNVSARTIAILVPVAVIFAGLLGWTGCSSRGTGTTTTAGPNQVDAKPPIELLNVSYDPTREFYLEYNQLFAKHWKETENQEVTIKQSHGGSGKQARAVMEGQKADVVTLSVGYDLNAIARKAQLFDEDWKTKLPHNSAPYTSTIVFLVRKGNPKQIKDWGDLVKGDIEIVTASPKTGGGSRWNYLAAWGYVLKRELGDLKKINDPAVADEVKTANEKALQFITELYKRVTALDPGARASTLSFTKQGLGDVLLTWENEAFLTIKEMGDEFEIVVPSISILAEPPVAVVAKNTEAKGTTKVAEAYLQHLYSPAAQQLAAKHYYRPAQSDAISPEQQKQFVQVELFTIDDVFGGWDKAQATHFDDGGFFDQIYKPQSK